LCCSSGGDPLHPQAHFDGLFKDLKCSAARFVPAGIDALYLPGDAIAVTFSGQSPNKAFTILFGPHDTTNDDVSSFFLSNKHQKCGTLLQILAPP
jgi:hypothetical protein